MVFRDFARRLTMISKQIADRVSSGPASARSTPGVADSAKNISEAAGHLDRTVQDFLDHLKGRWVSPELDRNLELIKATFRVPTSSDIIIRPLVISVKPPVRAFVVYVEGVADWAKIDGTVIKPLMIMAETGRTIPRENLTDTVVEKLLPGGQTKRLKDYGKIIDLVLTGMTALFVDGMDTAFLIETKGWEHRPVSEPSTEKVVQGPQEGFVELLRVNTALIRRRVKSPNLITEQIEVGRISKTQVALIYIDGLANSQLVDEARRRLKSIDVDFVTDSGMLTQYIEDRPYSLLPTVLTTERPDRVGAYLLEGHVAMIVEGSPFALVVPVTFTGYFHSPEDIYLRWPYGVFIRLIRVSAILTATFLPAFHIAVANYHQEMIPPALALAIASSRENVPLPVVVEAFLMEGAFELIREAGIRVPSVIGPTIGIVGALLIGQSAVAASLVSPIMVIIVATTALSSFTIPNYSAVQFVRILRFFFMLLAAMAGFYGISFGVVLLSVQMVMTNSFGMPFMSPITPFRKVNPDIVLRGTLWSMDKRPGFLRPYDTKRQTKVVRGWTPGYFDPKTELGGGIPYQERWNRKGRGRDRD